MKKNQHSERSEIATVVTLVLMVVGLVGTIFTTRVVNKNKIALNSKAAMPCEINQKNCIHECGSWALCSSFCTKQYNVPEEGTADRICISPTPTKILTLTKIPTQTSVSTNKCPNGKCGSGCAFNCPDNLASKCDKPNLEFKCCVAKTGVFYGCVGTPCNMIGDGKTYIPCGDYVSPTPIQYINVTPKSGDSLIGQKKCGSGYAYYCDPNDGYEPACVQKNGGDPSLAFRCCVFRSNGEIVDYGCVGTPCYKIGNGTLGYIKPCSSYSGYQSKGPGGLVAIITPSLTPTNKPTPTITPKPPKARSSSPTAIPILTGDGSPLPTLIPTPTPISTPGTTNTPTSTPTPTPTLSPGKINCQEFDCGGANSGIKYYAKCINPSNANQNCGSFNIYKDSNSCSNGGNVQLTTSSLNDTSIKNWCNNQLRNVTFELMINSWTRNINYDPSSPTLRVFFYGNYGLLGSYKLLCEGNEIDLKESLSGATSRCPKDVINNFNKVKVELKYKTRFEGYSGLVPYGLYNILSYQKEISSLGVGENIIINVSVE